MVDKIREEYDLLLQDIVYRKWLIKMGLHETYKIVMIGDGVLYG